jgi:hypothetical protein
MPRYVSDVILGPGQGARPGLLVSALQHPARLLPACPPMPRSARRSRATGAHHQILAMRSHLSAPDHGCMCGTSARYVVRINGHLGATLLSAFPTMAWRREGTHTVLTGTLDRPGLHGVLTEIEALGLELLEVRQLAEE